MKVLLLNGSPHEKGCTYTALSEVARALAEGQFTEEATLHVTQSTQAPPQEAGADAVVWDVSLTGTQLEEGAPVPLRLLSPEGGRVWQYQNGQWQQAEAVANGQYLLLTMTGTQGTFCIRSSQGIPWLIPAAVGGAALAALLLIAGKRKKEAAKEQKKQEETSE